MNKEPLTDEKRHQLYRLEEGLRKIHEATTRFNSHLTDFDPSLRALPEFFLQAVAIDLVGVRRADELAQDQQRARVMESVLEVKTPENFTSRVAA